MKYAAVVLAVLTVLASSPASEPATPFSSLREALEATDVTGGVLVHLGCGDGSRTIELLGRCQQLHALDEDSQHVAAARVRLQQTGCYGTASADCFDGNDPAAARLEADCSRCVQRHCVVETIDRAVALASMAAEERSFATPSSSGGSGDR